MGGACFERNLPKCEGNVSLSVRADEGPSAACDGSIGNWRKSSFSDTSDCVEVLVLPATVMVRNTRDRTRSPLTFAAAEWAKFLNGIRAGEGGWRESGGSAGSSSA
jgi:hypothetical protein